MIQTFSLDLHKNVYLNNALAFFKSLESRLPKNYAEHDRAFSHKAINLLLNLQKTLKLEIKPLGNNAGITSINFLNANDSLVSIDSYHLERYEDEAINNTLPHEIAHVLAYRLYSNKIMPHGNEWRHACIWVGHPKGYNAEVYHHLETKPLRQTRKFIYVCGNCNKEFKVGLAVHRKMIAGQKRVCSICKNQISFIKEVE